MEPGPITPAVASGKKPPPGKEIGKYHRVFSPPWAFSLLIFLLFAALTTSLLWFVIGTIRQQRQQRLDDDLLSISERFRMRLNGNRDYLLMMAQSRAEGTLEEEAFQTKASGYVSDHPELINITWVDSNNIIRSVAPRKPNQNIIGLKLHLPEPARVSKQARKSRKPLYTKPFEAIQGNPAFEIWVPVFSENHFLGLFGGVYSCRNAGEWLIPAAIRGHYQITMENDSGSVVWSEGSYSTASVTFSGKVELIGPGSGLFLLLKSHERVINWELILLVTLIFILVFSVSWFVWYQRREIEFRKNTAKIIQDQYSALNGIIQSPSNSIYAVDRDYCYTIFNARHAQMMKWLYGVEIQKGGNILEYVNSSSDRHKIRKNLDRVLTEGTSIVVETYAGDDAQSQRFLEISFSPIKDVMGNIIGAAIFTTDKTNHRRAEQAKLESEEKYRSIFESSSVAILLTKPDGSVLSANEFACKLFDRSLEEICSLGRNGLIDTRDHRLAGLLAERREKGHASGVLTFIRKGGIRFEAETSSVVFLDHDGIEHTSLVLRDLTEQKKAETAIIQLNHELEQRVLDRTAQLAEINRELASFTYSVSHDLKAPLRGIEGYSKLLLESYSHLLDAEGNLFLDNIRKSILQMNQLIDDLLAYSRVERTTLLGTETDLHELVNNLLDQFQQALQKNQIRISFELKIGKIHADREGLIMILRNLIENSIKFMDPEKPPEIIIGSQDAGDKIILRVKDNGIGFDMKFHDRIFEIFQRLHPVDKYPGTGIGLAMVRKAMQRMGGTVRAESEPGKGTLFILEFPKGPQ